MALYVKLNYPRQNGPDPIELVSHVLRYVRQLQHDDLIATVLRYDIPAALRAAPNIDRAPVAFELACLYNEYGFHEEAMQLLQAKAMTLWRRRRSEEDRENSARRLQLVQVGGGRLLGPREVRRITSAVEDDKTGSFSLRANLALPVVWSVFQQSRPRPAQIIDCLTPIVSELDKWHRRWKNKGHLTSNQLSGAEDIDFLLVPPLTKSNYAELTIDLAAAYAAANHGRVPRSKEWAVETAGRIFSANGTRVAVAYDRYAHQNLGPLDDLVRKMGLGDVCRGRSMSTTTLALLTPRAREIWVC